MSIPTDNRSCQHTTSDGRRCRSARLPGDHTLCFYHYNRAQNIDTAPHPAFVAAEILPPEEGLDSAHAINAALTRVFRCLVEGRLSTRYATTLAYVGQLCISTLPGLEREAAQAPPQPLGADPDVVIADLAQTLRRSIPARAEASPAGDNGESSKAMESASPAPSES